MLFPYTADNAITAAVEALDLQALPDDVRELKRLIVKVWTDAENRIEVLSEELRLLQEKLFGRRAENWSEAELLQMRLFNEAETGVAEGAASMAAWAAVEVAAHTRVKAGRRPLPASLPRLDIIHDISEAEKLCGQVGVIREGKLLTVGNPDELRMQKGSPRVEIAGHGFNEQLLSTLRQRPEVSRLDLHNSHMTLELQKDSPVAPLVTLIVQSGGEVEEVCKGEASLEEVFLTLMEEEKK